MNKVLMALVLMMIGIVSGCSLFKNEIKGSGKVVTEDRDVGIFTKIELNGVGELYVRQGDNSSLRIEGEDNLLKYIRTEVKGDQLLISQNSEDHRFALTRPLKYYVTTPNITKITLSGSGSIVGDGPIKIANLEISILGSGDANVEIKGKDVISTISGSGNMMIQGEVDQQTVHINGAGAYLAPDLKSRLTNININGAGEATVDGGEELHVDISGAGSVFYKGSPKIEQKIKGTGKIQKI